jgi:hypothetical protein
VGFTPAERPRLAVAVDGMLAAIHEPARVTVVELPNLAPFAEIGIDREASACDVAWVGMPPRLLVLSRYEAYSRVHLLDPYGPRTIAEIRLESPMRLVGTIGGHALAVGEQGAAVLSASETHVTPYQFPARAVPVAAGAAGSQFVVALSGAIEEWDPASRMPKRRLRLPRPAAITALGGSDRVVWLTTKQDPARVDVIPIVNRGQPKAHDLPEPIAQVAAHPRTDLLACVGGDSGRLYVIDLDGRGGMRIVGPEGIARVEAAALVVGRTTGVLAAQAGHPLALVSLDGREPVETPAPRAAQQPRPGDPKPSKPAMPRDRTSPWRDELVAWYRAFLDGSTARDAPRPPLIDQLVQRFELSAELQAALALLYAAHLAGEGAAPIDIARVLDGNWAEALGRGQLAVAAVELLRHDHVDGALAARLADPSPEVAAAAAAALLARDRRDLIARHSAREHHPVRRAIVLASLGEPSPTVLEQLQRGLEADRDAGNRYPSPSPLRRLIDQAQRALA